MKSVYSPWIQLTNLKNNKSWRINHVNGDNSKSEIGDVVNSYGVLRKPKTKSKNISVLKEKMIDLFYQEKHDDALKYANRILEIDPTNQAALEAKVEILNAKREHVKALQSVAFAIKLDPENPFFWILKGRTILFIEGPKEALKCLDKALELAPRHPVALLEKGSLLNLLERYDELLTIANSLIAVTPNDSVAWLLKGSSLTNLGRDKEAFECLNKVLKMKPYNFYVIYEAVKLLKKLGKHKDVIKGYELLTKLDPENVELWLEFGSFYFNVEKYNEALQCYDRAIRIKVEEKITFRSLARFKIASNTKQLSSTEKILESYYMNSMGLSYEMFSLPDSFKAMTYVAKHKKVSDRNLKDWYMRGVTLYELGCYYEAINCFLRVIDKKPRFVDAWVGLTMSLFMNQNFNKALKALTHTISLSSYEPAKYEHLFVAAITRIEVFNKIYEASKKRSAPNGST